MTDNIVPFHPVNSSSLEWEYSTYSPEQLAALRAQWSANRQAQAAAGVGVHMPLPRAWWAVVRGVFRGWV